MSMNRNTLPVGVGVVLLVLALTTSPVATGQDKTAPPQLKLGQAAPPFTAETTDGKKIALADYQDKGAVLLVFYTPSSDGGEPTLRRLKKIHDQYRKTGFQVLVVPTEKKREDAAALSKHLEVGFPTIFDPKYELAESYKIPADLRDFLVYPVGILISRDGKVAGHGLIDGPDLMSWKGDATVLGEVEMSLEKAVREVAEKK